MLENGPKIRNLNVIIRSPCEANIAERNAAKRYNRLIGTFYCTYSYLVMP